MYVLAYLRSTAPRVVKFGPTSDQACLLDSYEGVWPAGAEVAAVLPVLPGFLLRVSKAEVNAALEEDLAANRLDPPSPPLCLDCAEQGYRVPLRRGVCQVCRAAVRENEIDAARDARDARDACPPPEE